MFLLLRAITLIVLISLSLLCSSGTAFQNGGAAAPEHQASPRRHVDVLLSTSMKPQSLTISSITKRSETDHQRVHKIYSHRGKEETNQISRRNSLQRSFSALGTLLSVATTPHQPAHAALFGGKERGQLDFCLVSLLRETYWAESVVQDLKTTDDEERRKQVYLQARLGAKALVTGKVGGGASNRVYQLSTLQFRDCLADIAYYGKSRQVSDMTQDLLESIAAVVEFDGLETTTDPSPRSSLTLSMYNPKKATYVQRLLSERVIPISKQLFDSFDFDVRQRCLAYVASTYPNEEPKQPVVPTNTES